MHTNERESFVPYNDGSSMKRFALLGCVVSSMLSGQTPGPATVRVVVPGRSNPYLAGMPPGTSARYTDHAPRESPVLVPLTLAGATAVSFEATGAVSHGPMWPLEGPEGSREMADHTDHGDSEHGISGVHAPMESLLGVFLSDERPDRSRAPRTLPFDRALTTLSPQLKQVFFIGSGRTGSGETRRYLVPPGATRLFLGTTDGYNWNNNTGAHSVTVTLERADVTSGMFSVDSSVAFAKWPCLPERARCTPEHAMVETRGPDLYHVLLPAQLEWGASIPNPAAAPALVRAAAGTVCLDRTPENCGGPAGKGALAGDGFLVPAELPGSLVIKTVNGRTWFSVNGRSGEAFQNHQGFFEFDVLVRK
jgi:hypothetical protein